MPATPNSTVTLAGSGVLLHVLNASGLPVPVQGDDDGFIPLPPSIPSSSSAYEAGRVLKASAGTFRRLLVCLDPGLASATYYVQLLTGSATLPANGAVTHLRSPQTIVHVNGVADKVVFDEGDAGIPFTVGLSTCVSSTQFTKTAVASAALFDGSVL